MEMPSFTRIQEVFEVIIKFLQEFVAKVEEMLGGIHYEMKGYPTTDAE